MLDDVEYQIRESAFDRYINFPSRFMHIYYIDAFRVSWSNSSLYYVASRKFLIIILYAYDRCTYDDRYTKKLVDKWLKVNRGLRRFIQ